MESILIQILNNFGFPAFVTVILLYDKINSNSSLKKTVENNTKILKEIRSIIVYDRRKERR